ncbi:hypothetical protein LC55x_3108 [Lysobacter capsici]|nr:hypothetical protein LC55x_3108 [Lysobacter capsici]
MALWFRRPPVEAARAATATSGLRRRRRFAVAACAAPTGDTWLARPACGCVVDAIGDPGGSRCPDRFRYCTTTCRHRIPGCRSGVSRDRGIRLASNA